MSQKLNNRRLLLELMIFFMVFQSLFERICPVFKGYDEMLAVLSAIYFLFVEIQTGWNKYILALMGLLTIYLGMGTISSIICGYQSVDISVIGALLAVKWFLLMGGGYALAKRHMDSLRSVKRIIYVCIILLFMWEIATKMGFMGKYALYAWDVCAKCVFLTGYIFFTWENVKIDYLVLIVSIVMLIMPLRAKGYAAVVFVIVSFLWILQMKRKIKLTEVVVTVALLISVVWKKLYYYYIRGARDDFARYRMFRSSIDVANDFFPFGTGWSTFGSYYAAKEYSPVYYLYGIDSHRELGVKTKLYLTDNYWPSVIAETGWIGLISMMLVVLLLFILVQRMYKIDIATYASGILLLFYMLVTTMEESGFAQPVLMCIGWLMGVLIAVEKTEKNEHS